MTRRMSCSLTIEQVRDRTKTETRRVTWTWVDLKPGDRLLLIEKGMGLKAGQKQVVLAEVEVVANDRVRLRDLTQADVDAEGFPQMTPDEFVAFWINAHRAQLGMHPNHLLSVDAYCRRIKWRYLT